MRSDGAQKAQKAREIIAHMTQPLSKSYVI